MTSTVLLLGFMVLMARALDGALAKPLGLTSAVCTTAIMRLAAQAAQAASGWSLESPRLSLKKWDGALPKIKKWVMDP